MYVPQTGVTEGHHTGHNLPGLEVANELTQLRIARMHGVQHTIHIALRKVSAATGRDNTNHNIITKCKYLGAMRMLVCTADTHYTYL